jgi:hypothetical protein
MTEEGHVEGCNIDQLGSNSKTHFQTINRPACFGKPTLIGTEIVEDHLD